jgi:hypothetical protein
MFSGAIEIAKKDPEVVVVSIKSIGEAALRPENPLPLHVSSATPVVLTKFVRGPNP